ncbi:hypothetical protein [Sandarakinorhabdus sp.]|uniref:hypothetical protein n=1 Tax=Sandarakinorhabdus sp. TaxID=1916663 RepID=UPI003F6E9E2C
MLMLTPLKKEGHNFKVATQPGSWVAASSSLSELAKALDVNKDAQVDLVRSTPDPWAQARGFADMLLDPTCDDRRVIGQWRALITILALAAQKEDAYRIKFEAVPLFERDSRFADVMMRLLPKASLPFPAPRDGTSCGWDRPVIMRVVPLDRNGAEVPGIKPLAMLNPASLVAPGRDADKWTFPAGWMREGLIDPLTAKPTNRLAPADLQLLCQYLDTLGSELARLCQGEGNAAGQATLSNFQGRISAFADDVRRQPGMGGEDADTFEFEAGDPLDARLPAPYRLLATPLKAKAAAPGTSQCIIPLRDDVGEQPFRGLVLLDRNLASDDRPATAITFWGYRTLQQALDMRASERKALATEIAKSGFLLVTPDDFFTEIMVRLNEEERPGRIALHPDRFADHLLPLSPLALLVLSPAEMVQRLDMSRSGRVSLRIKLDGRSHNLARTYVDYPQAGEGRLVNEIDWGLGDFALWPDFRSPKWQHYAARFDYGRSVLRRLRGRFAVSGAMIAQLLLGTQQAEHRAEAASLWASGKPLDPRNYSGQLDPVPGFGERHHMQPELLRLRARDSLSSVSEIQFSKRPFEAAFFTVGLGPDEPPFPAGMALLKIRDIGTTSDRQGDVAIDFGTTNTVACINDEAPARLQARLVHPVVPAMDRSIGGGELGQSLREFLPPDSRQLPSPTVVINRDLDDAASARLETNSDLDDALLLKQLIYFQPDFASDGTISSVGIGDWTSLLRRLRFNLKWSRQTDMRDAARRYIRQLVLMLAAEWAADGNDPAKLRWHFSRPRNMGDDQDFGSILRRAIADVIPNHRPDALYGLTFEGDAAAAYILNDDTKRSTTKGRINIILDIGGGTTDIAIWTGGTKPRQLFSGSVRLAGGDFFTGHITENPDILEEFGLKPWAQIVSQLNQQSDADVRDNVRYVGELLFSGKTLEEAIDRNWSRVSGTDRIRHLKETAFSFLGGIAWQIGWQLRQLIMADELAEEDLKDIAVALCGRGSGLFARLHGKDPQAQTDVSRILRLIAVGARDTRPGWPQVQVSPFPKIEVAAGMIIKGRQTRDQAPRAATPAGGDDDEFGEVFANENDNDRARQGADAGKASYTAAAPSIGEEALEPFLRAFAIASRCAIELSDFQRKKLKNRAAELRGADEDAGREEQSEFADLLKALVEMMRSPPGSPVKPQTLWK